MMHKVLEDWAFPRCNFERVFQYWHCGDPYVGLVALLSSMLKERERESEK